MSQWCRSKRFCSGSRTAAKTAGCNAEVAWCPICCTAAKELARSGIEAAARELAIAGAIGTNEHRATARCTHVGAGGCAGRAAVRASAREIEGVVSGPVVERRRYGAMVGYPFTCSANVVSLSSRIVLKASYGFLGLL